VTPEILLLSLARSILVAAGLAVVPLALIHFDGGTALDPFSLDGSTTWGLSPGYATLLFFMLGLSSFPPALIELHAARRKPRWPSLTTALATLASLAAFALLVAQFGYTMTFLDTGSVEAATSGMRAWLGDMARTWDSIALRSTALVVPLAATTRLRLSRLDVTKQTLVSVAASLVITGALVAVPRAAGEQSRARWAIVALGCAASLPPLAALLDAAPRALRRPA
jgi:hypothetical protein